MSAQLDIASLAAALAAAQQDWDERAIEGALIATQNAHPQWTPGQVWLAWAREIAAPDGHPRNILAAARGSEDATEGGYEDSPGIADVIAAAKARAEQAAEAARLAKLESAP